MTKIRDALLLAVSILSLELSAQRLAVAHSGVMSAVHSLDSIDKSSRSKSNPVGQSLLIPDAHVGKVSLFTPTSAKSRALQLMEGHKQPLPPGMKSAKVVPGGGLYLYASFETAEDTRSLLAFDPNNFMGGVLSPFGVTDDGLKNVTHLTGIETLDLRNSDLTDAGLSSVGQLKNLTVLNCNSCLLNGTGLRYLSGLTKLSFLSLSKNQLNDRVLSILPSLPRLQYLHLRRCSISDACLGYVAKLPQLERLDLSDNRGITSKGIAQLYALDKLQVLRIDNTMIRPNDAAVFKQFKSLKTVLIGGADFDSATVSAWQKELPHVGVGLAPGQSKLQTQMPAEIFRPLH